ncbi:MAG: hypothetical protein IKT32_03740 [Clostridia bacterium]|nr:hypothetical protein [Clostridia bacterium]
MTIAELARYIKSYQRREKQRAQERAAYDYMQANLIARSVASYFSEEITVPTLQEAYSGLFEDKAQEQAEEKARLKAELSVLRFKQFANYHNRKYEK